MGPGALTVALSQAGLEAWGADVEPVGRVYLGERFRLADLTARLPWSDGSFDAVISAEGIEHLENQFAFLREARHILRSGGTPLITTPSIVSLRSLVRFFGSGFFGRDPRALVESGRHPMHHIGLSTFADLRYALHTSGFHLVETSATRSKPVSCLYSFYVPWM